MAESSLYHLPISVLIPVKNDERNLELCLSAIRHHVDQVVVVDSQSEDNTSTLCQEYGAELIQFHWNGKFPKKRNWALMNHDFRNSWILLLDADERPTPAFFKELKYIIANPTYEAYWLVFQNFFMKKQIRGDNFRKIALIPRGKVFYEKLDEDRWSNLDMEVHEHPIVDGEVGVIQTLVPHHDHRGLSSYMMKHLEYSDWEANKFIRGISNEKLSVRQMIKYRLLDSWLLGPFFFFYLYIFRLGFLDGKIGLTFCIQKWVYFWNIKSKINALRVQS